MLFTIPAASVDNFYEAVSGVMRLRNRPVVKLMLRILPLVGYPRLS
jgi:hypothetical protein